MITMRSKLKLIMAIALLVIITGVFYSDMTYAAAKIHVKKKTVSIVVGNTYQQNLIDKKGKTIKATKVKWKSAKTSVAKINKKGKVTAVKAGTAKMTAKYAGKTYKFTVKVKAPFQPGDKPKNLSSKYYSTDDKLWIDWDYLNNAQQYEIYISINDGQYELLGTSSYTYYIYEAPAEDTKYTFKVRGVTGKYYSDFSEEMIYLQPKKYNESITADVTSLDLEVGETKTIKIKTDKGYGITCKRDNGNVDCKWGEWDSDNNIELIVTGSTAGETILTVCDLKDNSIQTQIHVNVFTGLQKLHDYIENYGYINGNGDKTVKYEYSSNIMCFYISHEDNVEFYMYREESTSDYTTSSFVQMIMYLPSSNTVRPKVTYFMETNQYGDYYLEATTSINTSTYSKESSTYFTITDSSFPSTVDKQEICQANLKAAMGLWQMGLLTKFGMDMSELGFTNY